MTNKATVELAVELTRGGIPWRDAIGLAMACDEEEEAIELVGPKGYIHGYIYVGTGDEAKPAPRTPADVHKANGFSRAFADALAPPDDGSHGFGAPADPRRSAALHIGHSVAMSHPEASHAQLAAETARLLGVPVPKGIRTPAPSPPTSYEKPPTAAQASRAHRIASAVSGLKSAGPGSPIAQAAAYHAAASYALLQPKESDAAIKQVVGQILSGAGIAGR